MSMPGWYPDPAGGPGRYRFWDGSAWSNHTTTNPADPTPFAGGGRPAGGRRNGTMTGLIVALVAVVVIAILAWLIFGGQRPGGGGGGFETVPEDTNSSTPTVQGWDETSKPTPPPTTAASMVTCPYTSVSDETPPRADGRLYGGGISAAKIQGWEERPMYLQWVSDFHAQMDEVRLGWVSNIGVGQLNTVDGFTSPQVGAQQSMECFASSGYYLNFTHRVDLINEATTIDGYPAWRLRSEVHIESADMPEIDGDVVDILVIDLGDPERMGIFVSSVTIGDERRQALVDASIASLRVE